MVKKTPGPTTTATEGETVSVVAAVQGSQRQGRRGAGHLTMSRISERATLYAALRLAARFSI
jgi:hypothetical protein